MLPRWHSASSMHSGDPYLIQVGVPLLWFTVVEIMGPTLASLQQPWGEGDASRLAPRPQVREIAKPRAQPPPLRVWTAKTYSWHPSPSFRNHTQKSACTCVSFAKMPRFLPVSQWNNRVTPPRIGFSGRWTFATSAFHNLQSRRKKIAPSEKHPSNPHSLKS